MLVGTVEGRVEDMIPGRERDRQRLSLGYPPGTIVPVLYNPSETKAVIQDETLRVLPYEAGFWENEDAVRRWLIQWALVPFPTALLAYLICRSRHRRAIQMTPEAPAYGGM